MGAEPITSDNKSAVREYPPCNAVGDPDSQQRLNSFWCQSKIGANPRVLPGCENRCVVTADGDVCTPAETEFHGLVTRYGQRYGDAQSGSCLLIVLFSAIDRGAAA